MSPGKSKTQLSEEKSERIIKKKRTKEQSNTTTKPVEKKMPATHRHMEKAKRNREAWDFRRGE